METKVFDLSDEKIYDNALKAAAEAIRHGGIVVFPTETVYGLGANALDEEAVKKIFAAKGRPNDNPLIVHIADLEDIFLVAESVSETAQKVISAFMPGPISVVLKKNKNIPPSVSAGLDTVAVRCPVNHYAHDFIKACGVPIAAPSANISGKPSPTLPSHVLCDMSGKADVILTGGRCEVGLESTVVDLSSDEISILRPGAVSAQMLEKVSGQKIHSAYKDKIPTAPKSPGMKYRHYKPNAYVVCVHGEIEKAQAYINERLLCEKRKSACIAFDEAKALNCERVYSLGSASNENEAASLLFSALRRCDEENIEAAFVMSTSDEGIGEAFINRLHKASDEIVML